MTTLIISLIAAGGFGLFFVLLSMSGKKTDYMLDDYTEEDKPDNVRIINRDITKIIEKEVIKEVEVEVEVEVEIEKEVIKEVIKEIEVEKEVIKEIEVEKIVKDTFEVERLNNRLNRIEESKNKLNELVSTKNNELLSTQEEVLNLESKFEDYKTMMNDKLDSVVSEKKKLYDTKSISEKENVLIKRSMDDQQKENNYIIQQLKDERNDYQTKLSDFISSLEKNKKLKKNIQLELESTKEELSKEKENINRMVEDRDHFIKLTENKEKELKNIKSQLTILII